MNNIYTSTSERKKYPAVCYKAATDDIIFNNFKRDAQYRKILEHVSQQHGTQYLKEIKNKNIIDNLNKFKINDTIGNPITFFYGNKGSFSPTTLRYIKVLDDLVKHFDINKKNIIEIGGGYGGQYTILKQLFTPLKYSFVDLPTVLPLTEKYLKKLNIDNNVYFIDGKNKKNIYENEYDLVISNYAISECNEETQQFYIDNILINSKHGYITHNQFNGYDLNKFISILKESGKDVKSVPERPMTGRKNIILIW
jgi:putative sugar O-methyltransferase